MDFLRSWSYAQVLVQGQPHPSARNISTKQESQLRADASFTFDDIQYWVGNGSNKAALVIEWHDGNSPGCHGLGISLGWRGYRTRYDRGDSEGRSETSFINPIYGWMGYTIDGIGYGDNLDVRYDLDGAKNEPKNAFKFEPPITNPLLGQTGFLKIRRGT